MAHARAGQEILGCGLETGPASPRGRASAWTEEEFQRDLHHRAALRRSARQELHRGMPRRLHLRGRANAIYPPRRVRGLRRLRAGLPGGSDLLRRRRTRSVEGLLQGERRVLRRPRLARRRRQDRQDQQRPPADRRPAAAGGPELTLASRLPRFPWDALEPAKATAAAHPGGLVDLSIGTPVDPVPAVVRDALARASDSPGYPAAAGTPALREAAAAWLARRHGVIVEPAAVLPVIGTKELISSLPTLLGCGPGDLVMYPRLAYPTYHVGALLAGARPLAADATLALGPERVRLAWLNSPSNPTGQVLHPDACDGSHQGLLAVHSMSKRSNMAGYRAGFVTGDPALVRELLEIRKHAGLLVPGPVQAAMAAALGDHEHAEAQRAIYAARRGRLRTALEAAGWAVSHSEAGLYLWAAHPGYDCWEAVRVLASAGILVAPGDFYGSEGTPHIRAALTATDERIDAAVTRLAGLAGLE